jgi:hypothetical protein
MAIDALKGQDKFTGADSGAHAGGAVPEPHARGTIEHRDQQDGGYERQARFHWIGGSATEVFAFRVIEAAGLDKDKDMKRERLGVAESVALKDRKIDAFSGRRPADRGGDRPGHSPA